MQKRFFSLLLLCSVFGLAMYFISCQKESTQLENQALTSNQQVTQEAVATERGPLILGTVSTFCSCSTQQCNTLGAPTNGNQYNGIKIVLDPVTHAYYNQNGNSLTYTIRQGSSCSGPIVASFNCANSTVKYVSAALLNNTTYTVLISRVTSSSPCYAVTTSNCRSIPCDNNQ